MKITWFGSSAFRVQIGGQIVLVDGDQAEGVDRAELRSGADFVVDSRHGLPKAGPEWRPRPRPSLLEAGSELRPVEVWSAGDGAVLIDGDEERPLVIVSGDVPELGRWAGQAVIVVAGEDLAARASAVARTGARLIALAGSDTEVDAAFAGLRDGLDGTGLVALEQGLAIET
jgi:hypothetical protein